jgi:phage shock protein A
MLNVFKRLLKVSEAEAHAALDKLEDPIKMSEQAIRDLREDLRKAMEGLAEVKAISIRTKREEKEAQETAVDYEKKAMMLLKRAQAGEIDSAEADRLATEALERKSEFAKRAAQSRQEREKYDQMTANLEAKVRDIKKQIAQWENELKTLKARARISTATRKLNQQMANIDSSSTISTLERMRAKVEEEEALAQSYGEIAATPKSVDDEIEAALNGASSPASSESLAALKAKMGIGQSAG